MRKALIALSLILTPVVPSAALERKPVETVETTHLLKDTQPLVQGIDQHRLAIVWWVPKEYWETALKRKKPEISPQTIADTLKTLGSVSIVAVVIADFRPDVGMDFYSMDEVAKGSTITFADASKNKRVLKPLQELDPDIEMVLNVVKPALAEAMGNLGKSMHFFVLNDKGKASERLIDPYKQGKIEVEMICRDKKKLKAEIELPLNSLFVPRKCPNGRDAHISWKYCPWTGKKLED